MAAGEAAGIFGHGGMVGGQLGAMTALKIGPRIIRPLLVLVSLALTIKILLQPS